ncbi:MAG: NAD(P)H-dependent oxidoreductase subunit E [Alphaproteobacteria bacterium]
MPDPYYDLHIFGCINERPEGHERGSCARQGALKLVNYLKARAKEKGVSGIRVNKSMCLDRCELGPVFVIYPEGIWYHANSTQDMDQILDQHIIGGQPVKRLMLTPDQTARADLRAEQISASGE